LKALDGRRYGSHLEFIVDVDLEVATIANHLVKNQSRIMELDESKVNSKICLSYNE
jgi:hypothetical protein